MYSIGILGTLNIHSQIYLDLFNCNCDAAYSLNRARVNYIYGFDHALTQEVAIKGNVPFVVNSPSDMYDHIDAAMVIFRHGKYHAEYAIPFLERGIPVFIDKPFTISNEDAEAIVNASEKYKTAIMGGSSLKYAPDLLSLKQMMGQTLGTVQAASISFPATFSNEYGGLHFYGTHHVEMALSLFGYDCRTVHAFKAGDAVTAVLHYDHFNVTLYFLPESKKNYIIIHGKNDTVIREIDQTLIFKEQMRRFIAMLDTGEMPQPPTELVDSVRVMNAVIEAIVSGKEVRCGR